MIEIIVLLVLCNITVNIIKIDTLNNYHKCHKTEQFGNTVIRLNNANGHAYSVDPG